MGAGCSSPLRRFGGKRNRERRESSAFEVIGDAGENGMHGKSGKSSKTPASATTDQPSSASERRELLSAGAQHPAIENEITLQSELIEDQPSTASCVADGAKYSPNEESIQRPGSNLSASTKFASTTAGKGAIAAKLILTGSHVIPERHLLVSPALSPAPSTCYSPSPASSSTIGPSGLVPLDLNDLHEMFKTLTFGVGSDNHDSNTPTSNRIVLPERYRSEIHNIYTQQLVQTQNDLVKSLSVIFIHSASFHQQTPPATLTPNLANGVESSLKAICDEHQFGLRFLNLSHSHLSEHMHTNNLVDICSELYQNEYENNGQRLLFIVACTNATSYNNNNNNIDVTQDDRQLPAQVDAQLFNKLINCNNINNSAKETFKLWYNLKGNTYYLKPIYLVNTKILDDSIVERKQAWQQWLADSSAMIKALDDCKDSDADLSKNFKAESVFECMLDTVLNDPAQHRRTLLIKSSTLAAFSAQSQHQIVELTRILPDSNKLNLKRAASEDELNKSIVDWLSESTNKFIESHLDNQIACGKYVPPFIDRGLFLELTCQRLQLEHNLDNITDIYDARCKNFYTNQILPIINDVIHRSNPEDDNRVFQSSSSDTQAVISAPGGGANHLVFLSGPKGCGKSTLISQLIRHTAQEFSNRAQILYRYCGQTLDSLSSDRLLRSICEQFCQVQGENIAAASYIYSARQEVLVALNKIIKQQASLIFLDGLDFYSNSPRDSAVAVGDFDWLCQLDADSRLKIFITLEADSALYKQVLSTYSDATFISLDHPPINEWTQMLMSSARSQRLNSAANLYDEIKSLGQHVIKRERSGSSATDAAAADQGSAASSTRARQSTQLTYSDVKNILHCCRMRQLNNEPHYPELALDIVNNLDTIHQVVLTKLHYLMRPRMVKALIAALMSSRNGLTEDHLNHIMTLISNKHNSNNNNNLSSSSASLLVYVLMQLQPWLTKICDKYATKVWVQSEFANKISSSKDTVKFASILSETRQVMLEYYDDDKEEHATKRRSCESETINLLILTDHAKARERLVNKRMFYEQFTQCHRPEEFIEDCARLDKIEPKRRRASSSASSASGKSLASGASRTGDAELKLLLDYVRKSVYALRYDGSQIYSQVYCRAYDSITQDKYARNTCLADILEQARRPPIRQLLPISSASVNSFIKTRIGPAQSDCPDASGASAATAAAALGGTALTSGASQATTGRPSSYSAAQQQQQQPQARQRIFTLKNDPRHVLVIHPDKGSLVVWDLYEERAVRTIENMDQPRDLRLVDDRRVVALCNRELRVYDIETGAMLTKLKGVMNQKMPFFEVFGDKYVIALARNRMYVNMLNLNTGELETTFKVGEDRFLNSLLVSANGGICVCGDETQKPFPLLVWNLNERRLMYDLRMDRHEFITRMSAISDDGHFVVSVCRQLNADVPSSGTADATECSTQGAHNNGHTHNNQSPSNGGGGGGGVAQASKSPPNFIVIYDLNSGTLFKKWKPGLDSCAVAISLSADRSGKVINTIVDNSILVWDLATGSKRYVNALAVNRFR